MRPVCGDVRRRGVLKRITPDNNQCLHGPLGNCAGIFAVVHMGRRLPCAKGAGQQNGLTEGLFAAVLIVHLLDTLEFVKQIL